MDLLDYIEMKKTKKKKRIRLMIMAEALSMIACRLTMTMRWTTVVVVVEQRPVVPGRDGSVGHRNVGSTRPTRTWDSLRENSHSRNSEMREKKNFVDRSARRFIGREPKCSRSERRVADRSRCC